MTKRIGLRLSAGIALAALLPVLAGASAQMAGGRAFVDEWSAWREFLLQAALGGLALSGLAAWLLRRRAMRRLGRLVGDLSRITAEENTSARLSDGGRDGLGELTRSINLLLERTASSRQRLGDREETFRAICSSAQDAIIMMDETGRVSFWNDAAGAMFGYSQEEAVGRDAHDLLAPSECHPACRAGMAHFFETGKGPAMGRRLELRARRKGGGELPIDLTLSAVQMKGKWQAIAILRDNTERHRAEEVLRQTNERLSLALEGTQAVLWDWDVRTGRLTLGEGGLPGPFAETCELPTRLDSWGPLLHPDDSERVAELLNAHLHGSNSFYNAEHRLRAGNGDWLWVHARGKVVARDPNGAALRMVGTLTNIDLRKQAEQSLSVRRRCEQALAACSRALLTGTDIAQALGDALPHLLEAAQAGRAYVFENFTDEEGELCTRQTTEVCADGVHPEIHNPELQHLRYSAGFQRMAEILGRGEPINGPVSELPTSERELLESQQIVSVLVLPIHLGSQWKGFLGFDDTRLSRRWSDEDVGLLRAAAEMIGACLARRQSDERLQQTNTMMVETLRREKRVAMQLQAAMEQLSAAAEEAKIANQAKSEFLANMSHEIRTPMTAITGFAELMMEETPCCTVCPEHARCDTRVRSRRYSETILSNGRHLLEIVNDILDLSRIESGGMRVDKQPCDPLQIVAEVQSLMQARARGKSLSLALEFATLVPERINTDATRLRQILINLVGNAIKFTETGSVRVVIRLASAAAPSPGAGESPAAGTDPQAPAQGDDSRFRPAPDAPADEGEWVGSLPYGWKSNARGAAGPWLCFDVVDTGIGIEAAALRQLFRPFTQADGSTTRRFGGTGLGLAISKRLAEALGGGIRVRSQPGVGSTFSVVIATGPLDGVRLVSGREGVQAIVEAASPPPEPLPALGPCRVLLAEDGPDNQRLLTFVLTKAGAQVSVVETGQAAMDTALNARSAGQPFDLILMDMQMPVMDGYEATRQLRDRGYDGLIVALTAHAMEGDRERCLAVGCDAFTTKPINRRGLLERLANLLAERRQQPLPTDPGV